MADPVYKRVNQWRIIPRLMVTMYGVLFYQVAVWFMALQDPNGAQAAFVSTVVGAAAGFFGFYVKSGNND